MRFLFGTRTPVSATDPWWVRRRSSGTWRPCLRYSHECSNVKHAGVKIVHLVDSDDLNNMYLPKTPRPGTSSAERPDGRSPVGKVANGGTGFDDERFPLAKRVRPLRAVLGPGDMMYFPANWVHKLGTRMPRMRTGQPPHPQRPHPQWLER